MLNMNYEGKVFPPFYYTIEKTKIKELCLATGNDNPIFFNKNAAIKAGYPDTPVPLTFCSIIDMWGSKEAAWKILTEIGIDLKKMLDLKKEFEYYLPLYPGDKIKIIMTVESLYESELLEKATFRSEYYKEEKLAVIAKLTVGVIKRS